MSDPYQLQRFVQAQEEVINNACKELQAGRKRTHWMWFVFPQIHDLGHSPMAEKFAVSSLREAEAYMVHPILGARLRHCTQLVNNIEGRSISEIFGYPDDMKFRSSMTLFAHATAENKVFRDALEKYFDGQEDPVTIERL